MKQIKMLLLASMVMLFTACGGGGSSGVSTLPVPPESTVAVPPDTTIPASIIVKFLDLTGPFVNDVTETLTYDEDGNRLTETREFTSFAFNPSHTVKYEGNYTYDFYSNEATEIWTVGVSGPMIFYSHSGTTIYTFDNNGYILSEERTSDGPPAELVNTTYTYDSNGILLTSESTTDYPDGGTFLLSSSDSSTYDANKNVITSEFTYVSVDGSTSLISRAYTYDANGNLLTSEEITVYSDGSTSTITSTYDANGYVMIYESTTVESDGSIWSNTTTYTYDANGNVIKEESASVNPDGSTSSGSITLDANGNLLISEGTTVSPDGSSYYSRTTYIDGRRYESSHKSIDADGYWFESTTTYDDNGTAIDTTSDSGFLGPIANAGDDIDVGIGETVALDGSASSDPDGASLTYQWSFKSRPDGSNAVISNPTSVAPTFVADINGIYIVSLIVNNGTYNSIVDTVTINTY